MARARAAPSGTADVRMVSVDGARTAAPSPWTARAASSCQPSCARPPAREASVKSAEPHEEHPLAPEQVAGPPAEQHEPGERDRVGVDHPLQPGGAEPQVRSHGRQGDIDDGDVEDDEELSGAGGGHDEPGGRRGLAGYRGVDRGFKHECHGLRPLSVRTSGFRRTRRWSAGTRTPSPWPRTCAASSRRRRRPGRCCGRVRPGRPATWRAPASPRSCQTSSAAWAMPVAPSGWPLEISPPDGLTTQRPPYVVAPVLDELPGLARRAHAERLVGEQFVDGEAVVQLDHVDVLDAEPGRLVDRGSRRRVTSAGRRRRCRSRRRRTPRCRSSWPARRSPRPGRPGRGVRRTAPTRRRPPPRRPRWVSTGAW